MFENVIFDMTVEVEKATGNSTDSSNSLLSTSNSFKKMSVGVSQFSKMTKTLVETFTVVLDGTKM